MIFSISFILAFISLTSSTIIIPPSDPKAQGIDVGIIFIQVAEIDAKEYTAFYKKLQSTYYIFRSLQSKRLSCDNWLIVFSKIR